MSRWQTWTRLRAPLVTSQYSQKATIRDWSNPSRMGFPAMLDPATNTLYCTGNVDLTSDDRIEDPQGAEWRITTPTSTDVNLTSQNPVQAWVNPFTGWNPGTVVHIERSTP